MTDLFSIQAGTPSPMQAEKPSGWRAPDLPREHVCRGCAGAAVFGLGDAWFCGHCRPKDFMPHERGA